MDVKQEIKKSKDTDVIVNSVDDDQADLGLHFLSGDVSP